MYFTPLISIISHPQTSVIYSRPVRVRQMAVDSVTAVSDDPFCLHDALVRVTVASGVPALVQHVRAELGVAEPIVLGGLVDRAVP